jgi:hypothetical protein
MILVCGVKASGWVRDRCQFSMCREKASPASKIYGPRRRTVHYVMKVEMDSPQGNGPHGQGNATTLASGWAAPPTCRIARQLRWQPGH